MTTVKSGVQEASKANEAQNDTKLLLGILDVTGILESIVSGLAAIGERPIFRKVRMISRLKVSGQTSASLSLLGKFIVIIAQDGATISDDSGAYLVDSDQLNAAINKFYKVAYKGEAPFELKSLQQVMVDGDSTTYDSFHHTRWQSMDLTKLANKLVQKYSGNIQVNVGMPYVEIGALVDFPAAGGIGSYTVGSICFWHFEYDTQPINTSQFI